MPLWVPTKQWEGQDAYIIGGGPSLIGFEWTRLYPLNTVGCNDAFRLGPNVVKICAFGDESWFNKNKEELSKFPNPVITNSKMIMAHEGGDPSLGTPWLFKAYRLQQGLGEGSTLAWNTCTGALAVNIAASLGAHRIFLLGMDLSKKDARHHWHFHLNRIANEDTYLKFRNGYIMLRDALKERLPHVQVFNVTNGESKLDVFPNVTFAEVFP